MIGTRSELIDRLGQEYIALYQKYPEGDDHAWRPLAVGIAIAALAEEEYQMDWRDLRKKMRLRVRGDVSTRLDKPEEINGATSSAGEHG